MTDEELKTLRDQLVDAAQAYTGPVMVKRAIGIVLMSSDDYQTAQRFAENNPSKADMQREFITARRDLIAACCRLADLVRVFEVSTDADTLSE
jgi:hypothetical protein